MPFTRTTLSCLTRSILIAALVALAHPAIAVAGDGEAEAALGNTGENQVTVQEIGQDAACGELASHPQPMLSTPTPAGLAVAAGTASTESGLVYNPCYQYDDPSTGCYYKWRPSDYCCVSPPAWCPDICY